MGGTQDESLESLQFRFNLVTASDLVVVATLVVSLAFSVGLVTGIYIAH